MNLDRPTREEIAAVNTQALPVGGYIAKVLGAKRETYSWGEVLIIQFDICEGEHKDYYTNRYKNSQIENNKYKGVLRLTLPDENNQYYAFQKATFWNSMYAVEDSNHNFRFDISKLATLKDKRCGVIISEREWEMNGNNGITTSPHSFVSVDDIKNNKFDIPKLKKLKKKTTVSINTNDFEDLEIDDDSDLPF